LISRGGGAAEVKAMALRLSPLKGGSERGPAMELRLCIPFSIQRLWQSDFTKYPDRSVVTFELGSSMASIEQQTLLE
jgi:hypothetical protein